MSFSFEIDGLEVKGNITEFCGEERETANCPAQGVEFEYDLYINDIKLTEIITDCIRDNYQDEIDQGIKGYLEEKYAR